MRAENASFIPRATTTTGRAPYLARVPIVRQNTADDNDNDTLGNDHRADVRRPVPHGTGSVKAGNACPSYKN